jgi:hypothetical protein
MLPSFARKVGKDTLAYCSVVLNTARMGLIQQASQVATIIQSYNSMEQCFFEFLLTIEGNTEKVYEVFHKFHKTE